MIVGAEWAPEACTKWRMMFGTSYGGPGLDIYSVLKLARYFL